MANFLGIRQHSYNNYGILCTWLAKYTPDGKLIADLPPKEPAPAPVAGK